MQEKRNKKGQTLLLPVLCCHISKSWTKIEEECSRYPRTTDSASRIRRSYTLTAPSAKPTTIGLTAESCTNAVSRLFDYVRIVGESQLEKKIRLHVRGTSSLVSIDVLRIATNLKRPCCLASVRWWSSYSYIGAKSYSLSVIGSVPRPETRGGMSAETTFHPCYKMIHPTAHCGSGMAGETNGRKAVAHWRQDIDEEKCSWRYSWTHWRTTPCVSKLTKSATWSWSSSPRVRVRYSGE